MPLSPEQAVAQAHDMLAIRDGERVRLGKIWHYIRNEQRLMWLPRTVPPEVRELARISRVNMLKLVVNAPTQAMYVDGFRTLDQSDNEAVWEVWRRNRFPRRQIGVHRSAITFGASYVTVLPGDPVSVLRGASPRNMTVAYGDDDDWPEMGLERMNNGLWRLIDNEAVYRLGTTKGNNSGKSSFEVLDISEHGMNLEGEPICPIIRYLYTDDLDQPVTGIVEDLITLQDQINITTFGLMVAQHYGAFKQRYILGWIAETEEQKLHTAASRIWTFEDHPQDVQIGELTESDLNGYIASREATLRHLSTISQTPAHELLGQLVNLSAEALAAAEAAHRRAVTEMQTVMGESHAQMLDLAGSEEGVVPDPFSEVIWRDTESRSLAQVADAFGKLVQMLGVPPQALWEKLPGLIPGITPSDIDRWVELAREGDAFAQLTAQLQQQAQDANPNSNPPPPTDDDGGE